MKLEPGMAYKSSTLIRWFAFISLLFLFSVLAMFVDDYIRPWKGWQIKSLKIKEQELQKQIKAKLGEISPETLVNLEKQFKKAKEAITQREGDIQKVEDKITDVSGKIHGEKLKLSVYNGLVAELTFRWEHDHEHKLPSAPSPQKPPGPQPSAL